MRHGRPGAALLLACDPLAGPGAALAPLTVSPSEARLCPGQAFDLRARLPDRGTWRARCALSQGREVVALDLAVSWPEPPLPALEVEAGEATSTRTWPFLPATASHTVVLRDKAGVGGEVEARLLRLLHSRDGQTFEVAPAGVSVSVAGDAATGVAEPARITLAGLPGAGAWTAEVQLSAGGGQPTPVSLTTHVRHQGLMAFLTMGLGLLLSTLAWRRINRGLPARARKQRLARLEAAFAAEIPRALPPPAERPEVFRAVRATAPQGEPAEEPLARAETAWATYQAWVEAERLVGTLPPAVARDLRPALDEARAALLKGADQPTLEAKKAALDAIDAQARAAERAWLVERAQRWRARIDQSLGEDAAAVAGQVAATLRPVLEALDRALGADDLALARQVDARAGQLWAEVVVARLAGRLDDPALAGADTARLRKALDAFHAAPSARAAEEIQRLFVRLVADHVERDAQELRRRAATQGNDEGAAHQDQRLAVARALREALIAGDLEAADRKVAELLGLGREADTHRDRAATPGGPIGLMALASPEVFLPVAVPQSLRDFTSPEALQSLYSGLLWVFVVAALLFVGLQEQLSQASTTWGSLDDYARALSWGFGLHFAGMGGLTAWVTRQLQGKGISA